MNLWLLIALWVPFVPNDVEGMKSRIAGIGDIDGDGVSEIAVVSRSEWVGRDKEGRILALRFDQLPTDIPQVVWIVSAKDGALVKTLGPNQSVSFGSVVLGAGDVDGDGIPDVVVGNGRPVGGEAPSASKSRLWVYSGRTAEKLHQLEGGPLQEGAALSVTAGADVTGDKFCDIILGDPENRQCVVYSGPELTVARAIEKPEYESFGHSLALVPDKDKDGVSDFLVAWRKRVGVISSKTGDVLMSFSAVCEERRGAQLASKERVWNCGYAGDIDKDGVGDYFASNINTWFRVWSGKSGVVLTQSDWCGGDIAGEGASCAVLQHASSGTSSIAVGANDGVVGIFSAGQVSLFEEGRQAELISARYDAPEGYDVCGVGDVDGDGNDDVVVATRVQNELRLVSAVNRKTLWILRLDDLPTH